MSHGSWANDHFSAIGLQGVALVLGNFVRDSKDAAVATLLSNQGKTDTGVSRGWLNDGATGL